MLRAPRFVAALAAATLAALPLTAAAQAAPGCAPLLRAAMPAAQALTELGANLPLAAQLNSRSAEELTRLAQDGSLWLDTCGRAFYVEEQAPKSAPSATLAAAPFPYADTFALHSKPGSNRTIFLDFDGYDVTGTAWNGYAGVTSFTALPFSQDADTTTFNNAERDVIQDVWQRVAEDYAAFDVDVTTATPDPAALQRSSSTDDVYGSSLVVTNDNYVYSKCGCGGIAYVGVYNTSGTNHEYYQPAFVFTKGVGSTYGKYIAEAASHEVGHNLGLSHDGTSTAGYYGGTAGWAPLMGVGYYEPISQWSKGEYPDANQKQDDFAVMASYGVAPRIDDHANTSAGATSLTLGTAASGIIATPTDVDTFSFTPANSGTYAFTGTVAPIGPNLDMKLTLSDGSGALATADPAMTRVSGDVANGLGATLTAALQAGSTYFLAVDGVGFGSLATTGYSDYGSIGQFTMTVTSLTASPLAINPITLSSGTVGTPYSATFTASGGTAPYAWSATGLPAGLTMSSGGVLAGTPSAAGTSSITVTVTDAATGTASSTVSLTINAVTRITPTVTLAASKTTAAVNTNVTFTATVKDGTTLLSGVVVTFLNGATSLGTGTSNTSGVASLTVKFASTGSKSITATTPASGTMDAATSNLVNVVVATVPGTPTNVALTGSGGSLNATWTAPSDGGSPLTGYCVALYSVAKATKLVRKTCGVATTANAGHPITGLSTTTTYQVRVSATNLIGEGALSAASNSVKPA